MFDWLWWDLSHRGWHMLSLSALLGSMVGFFPVIAGFAAFLWYTIQICESATVQRFFMRHKARVAARRLVKLDKQETRLRADLKFLEETRRLAQQAIEKRNTVTTLQETKQAVEKVVD